MNGFFNHGRRIAVTLVPLVFALMHALGVLPLGVLQHLDDIIYDARLRATMPRTMDDRIVIVDFDEKSQAEFGWPWSRKKLAELTDELFDRQKAALAGFDVVFIESDESSGLKSLQQLARQELRAQPGFAAEVARLQDALDHDAAFARSLNHRPAVLGYYFTSDRDGHIAGVLPAPVMDRHPPTGRSFHLARAGQSPRQRQRAGGCHLLAHGMRPRTQRPPGRGVDGLE